MRTAILFAALKPMDGAQLCVISLAMLLACLVDVTRRYA